MKIDIILILIISLTITPGYGKSFTRCQLTKELLWQGFQKTFISNWVCLIEHASDRTTSKVTEKSNGSYDYGLFQINSKKWCKIGKRKGGICNMACEDFLNDDITDDAVCAYKIFVEEGFKEWQIWTNKCKGGRLPDVEKCPEFHTPSRKISVGDNRVPTLNGPIQNNHAILANG